MKNSELKLVAEIAGSCLYNILRSILEVWGNEAIGDLIGKRVKNRFILINAFPWQTAVRKSNSVGHGDYKARKRVIEFNRAINRKGGLDFSNIGWYHIHYFFPKEKRFSFFSKQDYGFFSEEMEKVNRTESLMIVASVRARRYKRKQRAGVFISEYRKSLRVIYKSQTNPYWTYDIILAAFLLSLKAGKGKLKKLKIRQHRIKVAETL